MQKQFLLLYAFALLFTHLSKSQDISYLEAKREADAYFTMEDYSNSIPVLKIMADSDFSKRVDFFFVAIAYSKVKDKTNAVKYMTEALKQGLYFKDTSQININGFLNEFRTYPEWETMRYKFIGNYINRPKVEHVSNKKLLTELLRRQKLDQKYRSQKEVNSGNSEEGNREKNKIDKGLWEKQEEIDKSNTAWLDSVIASSGWPGVSMVGEDGDHAAWLILQHADLNIVMQRKHLKTLQIEAGKNNTSSNNVAYLTDRVLVNTGKKQIYGTQFKIKKNDKDYPIEIDSKPLEYPEYVNDFRKYMGMSTVEVYLKNSLAYYQKKHLQ